MVVNADALSMGQQAECTNSGKICRSRNCVGESSTSFYVEMEFVSFLEVLAVALAVSSSTRVRISSSLVGQPLPI